MRFVAKTAMLAAVSLLALGAAAEAKTLVFCSEGSPEGFNAQLFTGRTMAWQAGLEDRVKALTGEQILTALRRHLDPAKVSIVKAGDFAKAKAGK